MDFLKGANKMYSYIDEWRRGCGGCDPGRYGSSYFVKCKRTLNARINICFSALYIYASFVFLEVHGEGGIHCKKRNMTFIPNYHWTESYQNWIWYDSSQWQLVWYMNIILQLLQCSSHNSLSIRHWFVLTAITPTCIHDAHMRRTYNHASFTNQSRLRMSWITV